MFIKISFATDPPSQPDPEESRNECESLNDPEALTPSAKNAGIQVRVTWL